MSRNRHHGKRTHLQYNVFSNGRVGKSPILNGRDHLSKAVDETYKTPINHYTERNFGKRTETGFHLSDESDDGSEQADGNHATPPPIAESNLSKPPTEEEEGGKLTV